MKFYSHVLIVAGSIVLASCGGNKNDQQQAPPPPTAVTAVKVAKGSATYYDEFPATVTGLVVVDIQPQVAGNITGIFFQDGQRVRKGQKLYTIDPQQYRASYDQAVANLNVQKANLNRAQKDADRYNTLAQQDAVAKQLVDNANASLEATKMQVAAAQASIQQVATNLKYTTIYAPLDGTIGISQVRLGAAVAPGSTPLNTISSDDPIAADVQVDESEIPRFLQLQSQKTAARDSTFILMLPNGSRYPYPGTIRIVDRAVDPQTGTLRIRIAFPNPNKQLKVGLAANVRVKNSTGQPQILIPYQAVTEQMSEYFVWVVGDSSKVTQKKITLGPRINDKVVVRNGINEGETIVTEGTQKVREGAVVKVTPPGQGGSSAPSSSTNQSASK
ncbi:MULTISPECIES: efflux RND transporter periplasmic adaptor subunit [Spirosoma]|uniref:Efflux RND transporter periplasmic adaptor subunit n=1 Tax=Spirosoma liriopis TaxID=2937440 RepID=A0ABT0HE92_9BACT|nr:MULTISPECIES: efflux RND transporter periplasmic adaptor subunit [Spirosoma]MCK8490315.1 efflux RND transporter periplasmic adaptor subunit [Spirosoma liriopis]UHG89691.1 efflux RND transporter periplasmic adaptor subunit [Spirosoma oryzicola]